MPQAKNTMSQITDILLDKDAMRTFMGAPPIDFDASNASYTPCPHYFTLGKFQASTAIFSITLSAPAEQRGPHRETFVSLDAWYATVPSTNRDARPGLMSSAIFWPSFDAMNSSHSRPAWGFFALSEIASGSSTPIGKGLGTTIFKGRVGSFFSWRYAECIMTPQ